MAPHRKIQELLDASAGANVPAVEDQPLETVRASALLLKEIGAKPAPALPLVMDDTLVGPAGAIPIRVYNPNPETDLPVVVYIHGGGWVFMGIETHDAICRRVALATRAIVVSVEYRLAPENVFPAGLEDCLAVVRFIDQADLGDRKWGKVDFGRIALAGDSAGGNLAAAAARLLGQEGVRLAAQVLVYPVCDGECATESFAQNGEGYFLTAKTMRWFWEQYLGPSSSADFKPRFDERASVTHATDFSSLPPTLVITAEFDPLRDEGEIYAAKLNAAGVPATVIRYDGMIHGFIGMDALVEEAQTAVEEIARFLKIQFEISA